MDVFCVNITKLAVAELAMIRQEFSTVRMMLLFNKLFAYRFYFWFLIEKTLALVYSIKNSYNILKRQGTDCHRNKYDLIGIK